MSNPSPTPSPSPGGGHGTILDTYTDPQGYVCNLNSDGSVTFTGGPMGINETWDESPGTYSAAQDAYNALVASVIPLPQDVSDFCDKCNAAAQALASAATAAMTGAATTEAAAAFSKEAGEAISAVGAVLAVFGAGAVLLAAGAAITAAAIETEQVAEAVMTAGWQGLETSLDLASLSLQVMQARSISDEAKQQLQTWCEGNVDTVVAGLKGALHIN